MEHVMHKVILLLMVSQAVFSANLGNYGDLFPVIEIDIREIIAQRLKAMEITGELAAHQQESIERISQHAIRPAPLNLPTTNQPTVFYIDPSITVQKDIVTPNGLVVARAGQIINPFTRVNYRKSLIFFNADDPRQIKWIKSHYYPRRKLILTGGNIKDMAEQLGRIYLAI